MTDFEITEHTKTMYYGVVNINGRNFDAVDLWECLAALAAGESIILTNPYMIAALKEIDVLKSEGNSRWMTSAEKGPKFDTFYKEFAAKMDTFENSQNWREC